MLLIIIKKRKNCFLNVLKFLETLTEILNIKMKRIFIVFFIIICIILKIISTNEDILNDEDLVLQFRTYCKKFGKNYHGDEFGKRLANFKASLEYIESFNKKKESDPNIKYSVGLNQFSDWHDHETSKLVSPSSQVKQPPTKSSIPPSSDIHISSEDSLDWRYDDTNPANVSAVTSIKNQCNCGFFYWILIVFFCHI